MIFDTCFLIDLQKERERDARGPVARFIAALPAATFYLSTISLGEFVMGFPSPDSSRLREIESYFSVLPATRDIAMRYGRISRHLRLQGTAIGTNDLWIAATAIEHRLPLVTRDLDHFRRVPDLPLIGY